ncbi:hypothetical protein AMTRI_Chr12g266810 [Amborella trichopoda]
MKFFNFPKKCMLCKLNFSLTYMYPNELNPVLIKRWVSFSHSTSYVFVNYLDRFLSCYKLPISKAWMIQLLSVACLYPATKMEDDDVPLSLHLHLLAHSTLKWRMKSVTPFSFFLEFKPFEIAAAVTVSVFEESKSLDFNNALSCSPHFENGKSPIRVLASPCLSYRNDDKTVGSCSSSHTSPASKNWKLN